MDQYISLPTSLLAESSVSDKIIGLDDFFQKTEKLPMSDDFGTILYLNDLNLSENRQGKIVITNLEETDSNVTVKAYDGNENLILSQAVFVKGDESTEVDLGIFPSETEKLELEGDTQITAYISLETDEGEKEIGSVSNRRTTRSSLNTGWYSQRDTLWKDKRLGSTAYTVAASTIGNYGCAMTCVAMLYQLEQSSSTAVTPDTLNTWLINNKGYQYSNGYALIYWPTAANMDGSGGLTYVSSNGTYDNWSYLDTELAAGRKVIVKVDFYPSTAAINEHWVLVVEKSGTSGQPGSYKIYDPWPSSSTERTTLAYYYDRVYDNTFFASRNFGGKFSSSSKTLSSVTLSGSSIVNENSYGDYTLKAVFSDGTSQIVTGSASWSENSSYAYFDSSVKGRLRTYSVSSNQNVTVTGKYTYGVTKSASKTVTILNGSSTTTGGVYGRLHINSASGSYLSGATVTCRGKSATTDSYGNYSLSGISAGSQTLSFSKTGYQSYQRTAPITAGQNFNAGDNYLVKNDPVDEYITPSDYYSLDKILLKTNTSKLIFQLDGNLVLYINGKAKWATGTDNKGAKKVCFQKDGNLVIYGDNNTVKWASNTNGKGVTKLILQADCNLVMYNSSGSPKWATNTNCY